MVACLADARYLAQTGRPAAAVARLRLILASDPQNEDALLWFAALQTNPDARRAALIRVLALNPGNPRALWGLAELGPRTLPQHTLWDRRRAPMPAPAASKKAAPRPRDPGTRVLPLAPSVQSTPLPLADSLLATCFFVGALALGVEFGQWMVGPAASALQTALPRLLSMILR